jgi:hypothetical protein
MGRQILFHMLPEDRTAFINFVQQRNSVMVTDFISDSAEVKPVDFTQQRDEEWLCLWNHALLPSLERKFISTWNNYRVEDSLPVLQFNMPNKSAWDGKPALMQGRLYAYAYQAYPELRVWYEALIRWIRRSFKKNPVGWMSGYVGPEANEWHKSGGLLLPCYHPPVDPEWRTRIYAQHPGKLIG